MARQVESLSYQNQDLLKKIQPQVKDYINSKFDHMELELIEKQEQFEEKQQNEAQGIKHELQKYYFEFLVVFL